MTKPTTARHCATIKTAIPKGVVKNSAIRSSHHRYSVFRTVGGDDFGVDCLQPTGQRRRDRINRIAAPDTTRQIHIRAQMPGKTVSPDQRVLRSGTFRVAAHVLTVARAHHPDLEIDQVIAQKPGFNALIYGLEVHSLGCRRLAPRDGACRKQRQRRYERRAPHYSAATGVSRRALAFALSSAINSLARAIGLVR